MFIDLLPFIGLFKDNFYLGLCLKMFRKSSSKLSINVYKLGYILQYEPERSLYAVTTEFHA